MPGPPPISFSVPPASTPNLPVPRKRARLAVPSVSVFVSLALHASLLALAAAIVWHTAVTPPPTHPAAHLLTLETPGDAAPASGSPNAVAAIEPARPTARPPATAEILLETPSAAPEPLRGLASVPDSSAPANPSAAAPASSSLSGLSNLLGPTSIEGAAAGHAAVPGIAEGPESVVFAGLGASSVKSVVYVVDASGSMVTSLPMVIAEVERSVSRLSPTQKFGVIIFRRPGEGSGGGGGVPIYESFAPTLLRPTASARKLMHDWLARIEPTGRSSPLVGLEAALALKPDAIFLLARSIQRSGGGVWDLGLDATLARLDQLNPVVQGNRRDVLIQTIQFLDEDPTGIMPAIGEAHGGGRGYRVIRSQKDLAPDAQP